MKRSWGRIFRPFPGLRFDVHQVLVKGPPWVTRLAVEMTVRSGEGVGETANPVMQFADLRWGRPTRIHTLEDTLLVSRNLERLAERGVKEALAPPIADGVPS